MSSESSAIEPRKAQAPRVRLHIDLFAYTLLTLSFGWAMMNVLAGWKLSLWIQTAIIFVCATLWTLFGSLFMLAARRACE